MVAMLGISGDDSDLLMPTFKSTKGITEVVIFCGKKEDTNLTRIRKVCESMNVNFKPIGLKDPLDLIAIAKDMKREVRRIKTEGGEVAVFNIAGGTRIMCAAALLVCTIDGLNAVYIHDDNKKEIPLPLLHADYANRINAQHREILTYLLSCNGRQATQKEIADHMKLHKATVNHHIKKMEESGMVTVSSKPGDKRSKLVTAEESMELLLEVYEK